MSFATTKTREEGALTIGRSGKTRLSFSPIPMLVLLVLLGLWFVFLCFDWEWVLSSFRPPSHASCKQGQAMWTRHSTTEQPTNKKQYEAIACSLSPINEPFLSPSVIVFFRSKSEFPLPSSCHHLNNEMWQTGFSQDLSFSVCIVWGEEH